MQNRIVRVATVALAALALNAPLAAQNRVTPPEEQFGHEIGAEWMLFNYEALHDYFIRLANESDRMVLDTLGYTEEGRPHIQAIITAPVCSGFRRRISDRISARWSV